MNPIRALRVSLLKIGEKPLIDPDKRLEFRGWCKRNDFDAETFVLPFIEDYAQTQDFNHAWEEMAKLHDCITGSIGGCFAGTMTYFLRGDRSRSFVYWWNHAMIGLPKGERREGAVDPSIIAL